MRADGWKKVSAGEEGNIKVFDAAKHGHLWPCWHFCANEKWGVGMGLHGRALPCKLTTAY